jgi:hypothetical protein
VIPFTFCLRTLQLLCLVALASVAVGLIGIFAAPAAPTLVKSVLGTGLVVALVTSSWLAFLQCPNCGKRFCGSQDGGDVAPFPNILTSKCRYCGHTPQP